MVQPTIVRLACSMVCSTAFALPMTLRSQSLPVNAVGKVHLEYGGDLASRLDTSAIMGVPVRIRVESHLVDTMGLGPNRTLAFVDAYGKQLAPIQVQRGADGVSWMSVLPVLGGHAPRSFEVAVGPFPRITCCGPANEAVPGGMVVEGVLRLRSERGYDADRREETWKAHDAVFGVDGELLTKGAGGKFPHHRGIFAGWNKMRCDGKSYDFWHGRAGETIEVVRDLETPQPSPFAARRVSELAWKAADGMTIVRESRTIELIAAGYGHLVCDVTIRLEAAGARVELDGDPHHGGVQIRLSNDVADHEKSTKSFLDPDAVSEGNDLWSNATWCGFIAPVHGKPWGFLHTTLEMPAAARYSVRPYGRFGSFCKTTLEPGEPRNFVVRIEFFDLSRAPFDEKTARLRAELAQQGGMTLRFEPTKRD